MRAVVAEKNPFTRAGLTRTLRAGGVEVVAEVSDAGAVVDVVQGGAADCCLIDVGLPGDGIVAAAEVWDCAPEVTVVMLADSPSTSDLLSALRAGARGYLLKSMDSSRLTAALEDACLGGAAIPRRLVTSVVDAVREASTRSHSRLPPQLEGRVSQRETDVLERLGTGHTTAEIAAQLSISPVTVRRHVSSIVEKLGVQHREAAVELLAESSTSDTPA